MNFVKKRDYSKKYRAVINDKLSFRFCESQNLNNLAESSNKPYPAIFVASMIFKSSPNSLALKPNANPTSCERWIIGNLALEFVDFWNRSW